MADTTQDRLDRFTAFYLNRSGDLKDKTIQRWHLATDIYASGVFASGYFDSIKIDGPTISGYVLTTDTDGWGTWQPNISSHASLTNLNWASAGHTIDSSIIPASGGVYDIGSNSYKFDDGWFNTLHGDGSNLTGIVTDFLSLSDTPSSYTGMEASGVRVNGTATGLEFFNLGSTGGGTGGTGTWSTFTNSDLTAGVLTFSHGLGIRYNVVQIFDNSFKQIIPDDVTLTSTVQCSVDLTSYGTITGTWYIVVTSGGGATNNHSEMTNLPWAVAGHTINADIVPTASGSYNLGSQQKAFLKGDVDTLRSKDIHAYKTITFDFEYDNGDSGSSATINWNNGNKQRVTSTAAPATLTFTDPSGSCNLLLKVIQGSGGSKTITWPTGKVKWPSATAPTLSTTAGYIDIITFYFDGSNYYGVGSLDFR